MKKLIPFALACLVLLPGCHCKEAKTVKQSPELEIQTRKPDRGRVLIKGNFYKDNAGNIYHRTIDRSAIDVVYYSFSGYMYYDTIVGGEEIIMNIPLKDKLDLATFHPVAKNDSTGRYSYYEDKNNTYSLLDVAEGGVLHGSRKQ